MPIYEYACTRCGERTEARQSFSDPPLEECPVCGGKLRKLYSPVGIVFKGSGFYSTDARKSSSSTKSDEKKPEKKSETTGSSSSSGDKSSSTSSSKEKSA